MNSFCSPHPSPVLPPPTEAAWKAIKVVRRQTFYTSCLHQFSPSTNKRTRDFYFRLAVLAVCLRSSNLLSFVPSSPPLFRRRKSFADSSATCSGRLSWPRFRKVYWQKQWKSLRLLHRKWIFSLRFQAGRHRWQQIGAASLMRSIALSFLSKFHSRWQLLSMSLTMINYENSLHQPDFEKQTKAIRKKFCKFLFQLKSLMSSHLWASNGCSRASKAFKPKVSP